MITIYTWQKIKTMKMETRQQESSAGDHPRGNRPGSAGSI